MESRSNLIKSKSSNSAIKTRSGLRESTRSNLQFQRNVIKKRGVYVEHKATKTRLTSPERNSKQESPIKSPPRPPPGSKRFLASVLTILSKNTAATQYPDNIDNYATHSRQKPAGRRQEIPKNVEAYDNQKKKKFRSKILNKGIRKDETDQPIIVLQPEKEMAHTSSIFSVSETPNFTYLPSLVKKAQAYIDKDKTEDDIYNDVNNSLVREILEGKQMKKDRRVRIEEPSTVVGNVKTGDDNNNGLYNFFVDLLGTINIQDAVDKGSNLGSSASSPKIRLEMNESVAKKLNVKCHSPTCGGSRSASPESHFFCLKDDDALGRRPASPTNRKPARKKISIKAQSFSMPTKAQPKLKTESFTMNTKAKISRKRRKENLLNMFKEQLKIDDDAFEEPQNLYEALKIIADNKRKCQKTIHFEEMRRNRRDSGFPECVFRRPWVLGTGKKRKAKKANEPIAKKQSEVRSHGRVVRTNEYTTDVSNGSQYSIKVIGYDYEVDRPKSQIQRPVKEVVFTYHSSSSSSDRGLGSNDDEFEYTDGYFNTFSRAPIDGF